MDWKLPDESDAAALNFDVSREYGGHLGIGGHEFDLVFFKKYPLEGRKSIGKESYHDIPVFGFLLVLDDDEIAIKDAIIDHGAALDLQDIVGFAGRHHRRGDGDVVVGVGIGFKRATGGDEAKHRKLYGSFVPSGLGSVRVFDDLEAPCRTVEFFYESLDTKPVNVLMDGRGGTDTHRITDFFEGRRVSIALDKLRDKIKKLSLFKIQDSWHTR